MITGGESGYDDDSAGGTAPTGSSFLDAVPTLSTERAELLMAYAALRAARAFRPRCGVRRPSAT